MTADRPSREYRIVHEAGTGLPLLAPVSDPPERAEEPQEDRRDTETTSRPSARPGWSATSWAAIVTALLGSGGAGAIIQGWRGDSETAKQVAALTVQVQIMSGQVVRLEAAQSEAGKTLAKLQGQLEPLANVRGRISEAESRLRQPPAPDVPGALRVLDQQ